MSGLVKTLLVLAIVACSAQVVLGIRMPQPIFKDHVKARKKEAVYLSKYLNDPKAGLAASTVPPLYPGGNSSYAGYITVNEECQSNLFYWFFPAKNGNPYAPVVLWLQGGYGSSSLFGLFIEHGPIQLDKDLNPQARDITWNDQFSMLYVDQPVGTGFSYTMNASCYATDQTQVAEDMYTMLQQFFTIHADQATNNFYVAGESMAGKYVPSISYRVVMGNEAIKAAKPGSALANATTIPFKGFSIGNGLVDPITQHTTYADFAQSTGLASAAQTANITTMISACTEAIQTGNFSLASTILNDIPDYICTIAGTQDSYDIRRSTMPPYAKFGQFVNQTNIRGLLNVGPHYYQGEQSQTVWNYLASDFAKSVRPAVIYLLNNHYGGLFYNGQFDIMVGPYATETMINSFAEWQDISGYLNQTRKIWKVSPTMDEVAGYVKRYGSMTQVVVRNAGHMAPADQPLAVRDMFTRFVTGTPF